MIISLTEDQKQEIYNAQIHFARRLRASVWTKDGITDEMKEEILSYADRIDERMKEEANWFIEYAEGVYDYLDSPHRSPYSWVISDTTFSDEMRAFWASFNEEASDDEMAEYRERLWGKEGGESRPSDYGVCDNATQIFEKWPSLLTDKRNFIVQLDELTPERNPDWRWHKNGEYIGTQGEGFEHLGDEKDIERIYMFQIIQVV